MRYGGLAVLTLFTSAAMSQTAPATETVAAHLAGCASATDRKACASEEKQFRKWYPLALRGDYQGQRNVAYCLADGCDGAVKPDKHLACAWRMIIMTSGHRLTYAGDSDNFKRACDTLEQPDFAAASAHATRLRGLIRK